MLTWGSSTKDSANDTLPNSHCPSHDNPFGLLASEDGSVPPSLVVFESGFAQLATALSDERFLFPGRIGDGLFQVEDAWCLLGVNTRSWPRPSQCM